MLTLQGSVGKNGRNENYDVALVQAALKNLSSGKSLFPRVVDGIAFEETTIAIERFQIVYGLAENAKKQGTLGTIKSGSAELKKLSSVTKPAFKNLVASDARGDFVLVSKSNGVKRQPNIPAFEKVRIPRPLYLSLAKVLQKAFVDFKIVNTELTDKGGFKVLLKADALFYDEYPNKLQPRPSSKYINLVNAISLRTVMGVWSFSYTSNGLLQAQSRSSYFYRAPLVLSVDDHAFLKGYGVTWSSRHTLEKKLLAAIARLHRKKEKDFSSTTLNVIPREGFRQSVLTGEILSTFNPGYVKVISEINRRVQRQQSKRKPLLLAYVEGEVSFIAGLKMQIGMIFDPNSRREYLYLDLEAAFGGVFGVGLGGSVKFLDKRISELQETRSGVEFSQKINVGPIGLSFEFGNGAPKIPPDIDFFEGNINAAIEAFKIKEIQEEIKEFKNKKTYIEGDFGFGEKKAAKPKNKQSSRTEKAIEKAREKSWRLATIDFGVVRLTLSAQLKVSTKVQIEVGAKAFIGKSVVIPMDLNLGLAEDLFYTGLEYF